MGEKMKREGGRSEVGRERNKEEKKKKMRGDSAYCNLLQVHHLVS